MIGIVIPIKVMGQLTAPTIHPDLGMLKTLFLDKAKALAGKKLEQEKQKLLKKHKSKIDEQWRDLLKELHLEEIF